MHESHNTLIVCQPVDESDSGLVVVDVKSLQAVVAMVPLPALVSEQAHGVADMMPPRYFVVEKPSLDVFVLGGVQEGAGVGSRAEASEVPNGASGDTVT